MNVMRESWTDERLDDLNRKVERGFEKVDERFERVDERFERVGERFDRLDERLDKMDDRFVQFDLRLERLEARMDAKFDSLYRLMLQGFVALSVAMIGGFATVAAAVLWA